MDARQPRTSALGGLAAALLPIAADPQRRSDLHALLGGYCHQVRNQLNSLNLTLYLARRGAPPDAHPLWDDVQRDYAAIERLIDNLQGICRPLTLVPITADLGTLVRDHRPRWARTLAARGIDLEVSGPGAPAVGVFDAELLAQGLDGLIAWRAVAAGAGSLATITWRGEADSLRWSWTESGLVDEPGPAPDPAAGLALPRLARIVAEHGGTLATPPGDGFRVELRWASRPPAALGAASP